ncbi:hypothetical protein ACM39_18590 [Chryseobacterium sp. FH2]|nr:hypothetical protein ACM39_18590 [Chryseobacterium sp. FH2]
MAGCFKENSVKNKESKDRNTQNYFHIKDILYRDGDNNLYFRTTAYNDFSDNNEKMLKTYLYINEIGINDTTSVKLKSIVDTTSFKKVSYIYYKDKNNVFVEYPMAYGSSFFVIENADSKTFEILNHSYYAKDKINCYYRGKIISGADNKSFRILSQKDGNGNTSYAKDNKKYYKEGYTISYQEIKDFVTN